MKKNISRDQAQQIISDLISSFEENEEVSIGIDYDKGKKGAIAIFDEFDSEQQVGLLYNSDGFHVQLRYYDDNVEKYVNPSYQLPEEDLPLIPEGLIEAIKSVFASEKSVKICKNNLPSN